jgi:hypothetical protein
MQGHEVHYMGADDTHGTPIMLRAEKEGMTPKELIAKVWQEHKRDFDAFLISFDHYYTTDSPENEKLAGDIYIKLRDAGLIEKRAIEQAYETLLDALNQHFRQSPYLLGGVPSVGDFGLLSSFYAHLGRDPYPADQMRRRAYFVLRWVERMNAADADMPEFPDMAHAYAADDGLARPLVRSAPPWRGSTVPN